MTKYIANDGKEYDYVNLGKDVHSRGYFPLVFFDGNRGTGKTSSFAKWALTSWNVKKSKWCMIARREDEWRMMKNNFWVGDNIDGFEVKNDSEGKSHIRPNRPNGVSEAAWSAEHKWENWGIFVVLSESVLYKNMSMYFNYMKIDKMMFDEFIIDNPDKRYIKTEPEPLFSIMNSVFRDKNVKKRVICFANRGFTSNPYYSAFNITSGDFDNKEYVVRDNKYGGRVLFYHSNKPSPKSYSEGLTDDAISYQVEGNFKDVTGVAVWNKKPPYATPLFNFINTKHSFIIYATPMRDFYWITRKKPNNNIPTYNSDRFLITSRGVYDVEILKILRRAANYNKLRFDKDECRNAFILAL